MATRLVVLRRIVHWDKLAAQPLARDFAQIGPNLAGVQSGTAQGKRPIGGYEGAIVKIGHGRRVPRQ